MPKQKRKPWTKFDVSELKSGARRKVSAPWIAKKLKRTEGATRQKAFQLGLSLETRGQSMRLAKRPVAFRVKDARGNWDYYDDESHAADAATRRETDYQGVYVRDRASPVEDANEI